MYDSIPDAYKAGVDGLVVSREAPPHPTLPEIFTLGECRTEDYGVDWSGPDTTRSVVVLYWGSFRSLSDRDPDFDWEEEVWETLTHELRHHLESLAREDALEGMDYAVDETFKRDEGLEFDPWYYQHGEEEAPGVFRVERNLYVEQLWSEQGFADACACRFAWSGTSYVIPRPAELGDIHFVWIHGVVEPPDTLELVLVRKRTWWEDAKRLLGVRRPVILESEARAEPIPEAG